MKIVKWVFFSILMSLISGFLYADSESGLVNIWATGSDPYFANTFYVQFKNQPPAGTGTARCYFSLLSTPLSGDGNKAMYATLLAAVAAGKPVTINYTYSSSLGFYCTVNQVQLQ